MKTGGKPFTLGALALAGCVVFVWLAIALPSWILEERALARLKSADLEEVHKAADTLGGLGSVKAIPILLEIMGRRAADQDSNDEFDYLDPLKSIIEKRGFDAVPSLVSKLRSPDGNTRACASGLLGDIGTEARIAIPPLTELLEDPLPWVREAAVEALFELGVEKEIYFPTLVQVSKDSEPGFRCDALLLLCRITLDEKHGGSIPDLIQSLRSESAEWNNIHCLNLLASFGAKASELLPWVIEKTKDLVNVRLAALDALCAIGPDDPEVHRLLLAALDDNQAEIRTTAVRSLSKMGHCAAPALPALKRLLESDPDQAVRAWAACAVLKLAPDNPQAAKEVKNHQESLANWATSEFRSGPGQVFQFRGTETALLSMGVEERMLDLFIAALNSSDPILRSKSLSVLEILGRSAKPALGAIIEAANDPDRSIRVKAIDTLGAIGPDAAEAVPALNEALKARDRRIRFQARRALSLIQTGQSAR